MSNSKASHEIDRQLVEFEKWCETPGNGDFEPFVQERSLPTDVAAGLRKTFELEKQLDDLVTDNQRKSQNRLFSADLSGKVSGNYRFICRLGVGGMGAVWLAEQLEPMQRQVAIKLIRPGMDSELFIKRFDAERQALASMSHPHIAKVLDAGTIENDRPYFVMEHVPGTPITDYCNQHQLSLEQRLALFLQLCDAIQHAHQKSLLHRDIKPTNVLVSDVDGKPHIKVIDFGLSKVFSNDSDFDPRLTRAETPLGSPLWMSPEQAKGHRGVTDKGVDTRSDIYSLGVILYELLSNTTPITLAFFRDAMPDQLFEAIREQVPPYPSVRLAEQDEARDWVANHTSSSFSNWSTMLRNDLDWVTMKALEKDRERRYPTVTALADDVRRFINSEPVIARPPSVVYRLSKLIHKHRVAAIAGVVVATLILVATAVAAWLAIWALNERAVANRERGRAEQIVEFVVREFGILNVSNPGVEYDEFKQRFLLSLSDEINRADFADDPLTESSLRFALARSLSGSGQHENAISELEHVIEINRQTLGDDHDLAINVKTFLAFEFLKINLTAKAETLADECWAIAKRKHGSEHELSIGAEIALNSARLQKGELGRVIWRLVPLVKVASQSLGELHAYTIEAMAVLADALHKQQRYDEASQRFDTARKLAAQLWGTDHKKTIELEVLYWEASARDFRFKKSPDDLRVFLDRIGQKFGPGHPVTLQLHDVCGGILLQQGENELAYAIYKENHEACQKYLGEDHLLTAAALERLAFASVQMRKFDKALEFMNLAVFKLVANLSEDSPEVLHGHYYLGEINFQKNEIEESLTIAKKYAADATTILGRGAQTTIDFFDLQARSLMELGRFEEALPIFEENWSRNCQQHGTDSIQAAQSLKRLATVKLIAGQNDQSTEYFQRSFKILETKCGLRNADAHSVLGDLYDALLQQGLYERAEVQIHLALDNLELDMPHYREFKTAAQIALADAYVGQGKFDDAEIMIEPVLASDLKPGDNNCQLARAKSSLAVCLIHKGDFEKAESLLLEALSELDSQPLQAQYHWYRTRCLERIVQLYEKWGKPEKAAKYELRLSPSSPLSSMTTQ